MSERKRLRRPRVTLCAAVTFDGKLDASDPLPTALLTALAPDAGEVLLFDGAMGIKMPPEWRRPTRIVGPAGLLDLPAVLKPSPAEPPVRRWLCLGGPKLFRALLEASLVDDLCLLVRPRINGRRRADTLSGPPTPGWFPRSISCRLRRMEVFGGDCFLHYMVVRRAKGQPS